MRSFVVLLVAVAGSAVTPVLPAHLPAYIKACKRDDPKLNQCAVKNGRMAIPQLVQGDQKLGIPKLDPLEIEKIVVGDDKGTQGLGIKLSCYKCKITGLKAVHLEDDSSIDLKKRRIELRATIPNLKISGKYTADGKVLILPIKGNGNLDVSLGDMKLTYVTEFDLVKGKDNKDHIQLKNPNLAFKAEKFHITLTNLFNGDKTLGNQMNTFLNENWREVLKEFGPAIGETVSQIVFLIVNSITQKVPYDEVFLK